MFERLRSWLADKFDWGEGKVEPAPIPRPRPEPPEGFLPESPRETSGFKLGKKSEAELKGVHPDMVAVVRRAIEITTQDFIVMDGLRTKAEQAEYVRRGVSQTMNSKHRVQADGYGHAVDLVPYINGKPRWEWDAIYPICEAVRIAAKELGVPIRWGGAWIRLDTSKKAPEVLVNEYGAMRRSQGRKAFTDGPHYELLTK